ncbi:histidine kinase CKI1 [Humulus lupulus]|uniref:histidine kinase CKI1 n=1 Tax=Humulus lupulus TaxID=3486 RepID=UPI002B4014BD|nr:histidine kinase CKI1 [Humulus lupulus]
MISYQEGNFTIAVVVLLSLLLPNWYGMIKHVKEDVNLSSNHLHSQLKSQIERTTKLFSQTTSSTPNLARFLDSSFNGSNLSFFDIENKVSALLFQSLLMTPHLGQISYIGKDGQLLSYSMDQLNQIFVIYSPHYFNMKNTNWYKQRVDHDTGKAVGDVTTFNPFTTINASWFRDLALSSMNGSYAFLGTKWDNDQDLLLQNSATVNHGKGLIVLGFLVKDLSDEFYGDLSSVVGGSLLYLATKDGKMIVNHGLKGTRMVLAVEDHNHVSVSFELIGDGDGDGGDIGSVTCYPYGGSGTSSSSSVISTTVVNIEGTNYDFYCSQLDVIGVESVYALAVAQSEMVNFVHKQSIVQLILLVSIMVTTILPIFSFVFINFRDSIIENYLREALIEQREATKLAEERTQNRSLAFARASHDIRAPLAGITGLIQLSYMEVAPGSDLETNLRQMDACTKDLLGILNSILDTSKIEAGMMKLEEEEFEMAPLLEEVADLYHPVGANREVDMILDPCDASVIKFSHVKGDRIKLKQILCNLLSNAIKCTPNHGQVVLRAWARKPCFTDSSIIDTPNQGGIKKLFSCLSNKKKPHENDHDNDDDDDQAMDMIKNDPHVMDFVFEVDDTGKGIPKEKRKELFKNYVQDKETSVIKGGTGLGLGIVKSLVELMHGEIGVVDKENGEKGACFRFNILLSVCEDAFDNSNSTTIKDQNELDTSELVPSDIGEKEQGASQISTLDPNCSPSPKVDRSYVVLMIQNDERRRVSLKFMKRLGIKVLVVDQWEQLPSALNKVKYMKQGNNSGDNSSNNSSACQGPYNAIETNADVPSSNSGNYALSLFKSSTTTDHQLQGTSDGLVVMVMDTTAGPISQLLEVANEFKNSLENTPCQIVWLLNPLARTIDNSLFDTNDIVMYKPFHGTRLYQVVRLLPEFKGSSSSILGKASTTVPSSRVKHEIEEVGSTSNEFNMRLKKTLSTPDHDYSYSSYLTSKNQFLGEVQEPSESTKTSSPSEKLPLSGKKILVVDDSLFAREMASRIVIKQGATTDLCSNGKEAFQLVSKELANQMKQAESTTLPYYCILMDCEMSVMNGYEATKEIRKEEKLYGVHIPIIGLTAHTPGSEETNKTIQAGMDACLSKPLKNDDLFQAIRYINASK